MKSRGTTRLTQQGFTLLEILVVVVIIGVMVTFAALSIGDRALSDRLQLEARRLNATLRFAAEEAEMKGLLVGFRYTGEYYEFVSPDDKGKWAPLTHGPFRRHALPPPFEVDLRVEGRAVPPAQEPKEDSEEGPQPQLLLLPSGEATAFVLALRAGNLRESWRLEADALGKFDFRREDGRGA